jgi:PAS domain S-box-containing protein
MTESIRVLHVDDESGFAEMTAEFLERENDRIYTVTETDASDALNRLADQNIDCIVSDYQMPGIDGLEFLQAVREDNPDLPFLLFTGKGSESVASDAIAEGATDYLQKQPGTEQFELLANRITNAVEQYRAKQRAANLDRIRRVIRDSNQALVRAETRDEMERRICEIITDAEPYCFAWIGEIDSETQIVEPRTAGGGGDDYLDTIEIATDDRPTGQGPTGRAVRTREFVAEQNIPESAEYEPWREDALERGYRSSAAIPIVHEETMYGVLNVYADRTGAFDQDERELLTELANDIAYARDHLKTLARRERLERIIEALPVGVYRATPEPDGEVVDANPALADIFDADSSDTLVGRQVSDFYQKPGDREAVSEQLQRDGVVQGKELRQETLDGDDIWIEVTAIRTEQDDEVAFGGIIQDITDRKKAEQDLKLFRAAVESAGHSIYFTDTDGTIEYVNPAFEEITGYTADEAIGRNPRILKSGEHGSEFYEELWNTILAGDIWRDELINTTKSGDRYVIDQTIAPVDGASGDIEHFVAVNVGVTERKEYEQELQRENERLDEFAGVISHDLRNPLNVAQGRARLLQQEVESAHIQAIVEPLERMEAIVEDTLTLAHQGKLVGDKELIKCHLLSENCWKMVETREATLEIADEFTLRGDPDRLRAVCENLFRNAVEHGGKDVTVRIGQIDDRGFYVADDGSGIAETERSRVFEAGFSTDKQGTRLGLTIVKQIVEAHGWQISVTDSETGGARFEITEVQRTL